MQNFGIVLSDIKYISEEVHQSMKGTEVIANDLLLNITGGSLGRCAVVPINFKIGNVSQHVCILRTVLVKPEYLHCFILSSFFAKSMKITGSGREGLPKYNLEKMLFPLPPIHEQERIIIEVKQLLNCIDKLDTCRGNLIELVSQAKSKVLDLAIHGKLVQQDPSDEPASELLKRINPNAEITCDTPHYRKLPFQIPFTWAWCSHNDVLEISGGSQPAKRFFSSVPQKGYVRLYQIRDYGENPIPVYIPTEYAMKQTEKGDILLARYGGSLGKVFHAQKGAYNVAMAKVIFKDKDLINKEYAYFYYLSDLYQGRLKEISRTAQAGFNSSDFNEMYFPLPPYEEQQRIVNAINKAFTTLDVITENL